MENKTNKTVKVMDWVASDGAIKLEYKTYVPYQAKIYMAKEMVQNSLYVKDGLTYVDELVLKVNTFGAIIALYTNLELKADGRSLFDDYDVLMDSGYINIINGKLGEDVKEFKDIINTQVAMLDKERNSAAVLNNIFTSVLGLFDGVLGGVEEIDVKELMNSLKEN